MGVRFKSGLRMPRMDLIRKQPLMIPPPRLPNDAHSAPRAQPAAWACASRLLVAGLVLGQLTGCAAQLWPPSAWSLSVDLPFIHPRPTATATAPSPAPSPSGTPTSARLKDPVNASEALAYAEALCSLPLTELTAEIERLKIINAQDGHNALRAQQLAFAEQLAQLYAEQQFLQDSNDKLALQLRERQRRIEQLNGQIEAMRAVEYSLPAAAASGSAPLTSATKPTGTASPSPKGATSLAIPSAPTVSKPLPASAAEPAASRDEPDAKAGEDVRPPSEP